MFLLPFQAKFSHSLKWYEMYGLIKYTKEQGRWKSPVRKI
jgi:hypothetical protein